MIAADVANRRETPVFDVQGWTDALFPESQAASMVERLRAVDPRWPVFMYASDLGHPPANNNKFSEWSVINQAATSFLDLHVARSGGADPTATYQQQVVRCDSAAGPVFASGTISGASPARLTLQSSETGHLTASAPTDAAAGAATDPIAVAARNCGNRACVQGAGIPPHARPSPPRALPGCAALTTARGTALSPRVNNHP